VKKEQVVPPLVHYGSAIWAAVSGDRRIHATFSRYFFAKFKRHAMR
jgi:hypothetical protein